MAVSYEVVGPVFVAAVAVLAVLWLMAPRLATARPLPPNGPSRMRRAIRVVSGVLLIVLVAGALALRTAGAPIDPGAQPLVAGGASGGSDPRLIAVGDPQPLQNGSSRSLFYYAYAPGAEYRIGMTLANAGRSSLTVTGVEPSDLAAVQSIELRLPSGELTGDLPPAYPSDGGRWASESFHPFTIAPGGEVGVVVAVRIRSCHGQSPRPTLAPGATPMPATDPSLGSGFLALSSLRLRYEAFGISRTAAIELFDPIEIAFEQPAGAFVSGCIPE